MRRERLRVNEAVLTDLKEALASAKLERCACDPAAQREMKLYLDTWVVHRLERAIAHIEGRAVSSMQGRLVTSSPRRR